MTVKRLLLALGATALVVLVAIGLVQLGASSTPPKLRPLSVAEMRARLVGSPAPLAALHAQAGEIVSGGASALQARMSSLHGHAVVVNKWASWCVPCRSELGVFQHVSTSDGKQVAFVGIDSGDASRAAAQSFLHSHPLSYPSYYDRSGELGTALTQSTFTPVTAFYDARGRLVYTHQGPYLSTAKLETDVRRYALDA
ncbi:MAG TPA: TlpA disulfide reductase family protein [Solirubrobacteraceae bacterium]|jgi:thiol-disulfide isomerase/thioredoxin|nr:TlpA disulfide reductase family protein [Solirubrobacteraceae bacterium]